MKPGDVLIDYSGFRPKAAQVKKDGAAGILRYSAGVGNSDARTQFKLCGKNEIRDAVAAGLDFVANSEWYESRITEGIAAGRADGAADLLFWKSRGLARGATVYVSWDQEPARSKWDAAVGYLAGYGQALGGYYNVGCYGGTPFLQYALAKGVIGHGWRPNAGSWSGDALPYQPKLSAAVMAEARRVTPAHIWQTGNYWYGQEADENVILRTPVGSHLEALAGASGELTMDAEAQAAFAALNKRLDALPSQVWNQPIPVPDDPQKRTYTAASWLVNTRIQAGNAAAAVKAAAIDTAAVAADIKNRLIALLGGQS